LKTAGKNMKFIFAKYKLKVVYE